MNLTQKESERGWGFSRYSGLSPRSPVKSLSNQVKISDEMGQLLVETTKKKYRNNFIRRGFNASSISIRTAKFVRCRSYC